MRGCDYVKDVEKKRTNKPLWKHIVEKHGGVMELALFSQFSMKLVQFFEKPQRRKANEGVRIVHLNPDSRMNSKDEFLQGTTYSCNLSGEWGSEKIEKLEGGSSRVERGDHNPMGRPLREGQGP